MKSMAKAILFGGFILAAQAAVADVSVFPSASDDAGITLAPRVTNYSSDGLASDQSTFPGKAPDGVYLPANVTYASEHAGNAATTTVSAFPGASDDAGVQLTARSTYADTHQAYRQTQGTDTGAN